MKNKFIIVLYVFNVSKYLYNNMLYDYTTILQISGALLPPSPEQKFIQKVLYFKTYQNALFYDAFFEFLEESLNNYVS